MNVNCRYRAYNIEECDILGFGRAVEWLSRQTGDEQIDDERDEESERRLDRIVLVGLLDGAHGRMLTIDVSRLNVNSWLQTNSH